MRIAQVSTPYEDTPPAKYGGTERVVSLLTETLQQRGHDVTLFATQHSQTAAHLHAVSAKRPRPYDTSWEAIHAREVLKYANQFDLIHNHNKGVIPFLAFSGRPRVTTIHDPIAAGQVAYFDYFREEQYVTVSQSHRAKIAHLPHIHVVANSIRPEEFPFSSEKEDFLLFVGCFTSAKGADIAIEVAHRLDKQLIIIAPILDIAEERYYEKQIAPFLDQKQICALGELGEERKDFFRRAKCLLCPIRGEEPFGLVMIEAMVCGTPVIAFDHASVPEIVDDGVTGFTPHTLEEMIQAVQRVESIDPAACREHVVRHFNVESMVDAYLDVYQKILRA